MMSRSPFAEMHKLFPQDPRERSETTSQSLTTMIEQYDNKQIRCQKVELDLYEQVRCHDARPVYAKDVEASLLEALLGMKECDENVWERLGTATRHLKFDILVSHFIWRVVNWTDESHTSKKLRQELEKTIDRGELTHTLRHIRGDSYKEYVPPTVKAICFQSKQFYGEYIGNYQNLYRDDKLDRALEHGILHAIREGGNFDQIFESMRKSDRGTFAADLRQAYVDYLNDGRRGLSIRDIQRQVLWRIYNWDDDFGKPV